MNGVIRCEQRLSFQHLTGRQQRKDREIPQEAVRLYTRAMLYEQRGNTDRAIELYTQVATQFPQYTEAQQQLEQLRGD